MGSLCHTTVLIVFGGPLMEKEIPLDPHSGTVTGIGPVIDFSVGFGTLLACLELVNELIPRLTRSRRRGRTTA